MVKVDLGVHIDGYVADTAQTVDLGDNALLVEASRAALDAAIALVRPGATSGELGTVIQHEIVSRGFRPVANLTGHGLSKYSLHGEPMIPNIAMTGGAVFEEDMVFAVEPFASSGTGMVSDSNRTVIYSQTANRGVRLPSAKRVMDQIRDRRSLPFSKRWLTGDKIDLALSKRTAWCGAIPSFTTFPGHWSPRQNIHSLSPKMAVWQLPYSQPFLFSA